MNRHTDQLYRLAEIPAFIEEALSNVSLKGLIHAYIHKFPHHIRDQISIAAEKYAEQWVDDWMARHRPDLWDDSDRAPDPEIRAIEAGVKLFSNPDCKAGLPE